MNETEWSKLTTELTVDEGKRQVAYDDKTGVPLRPATMIYGWPTIGVGRNLVTVGLSSEEIAYLLDNDIRRACDALDKFHPWWRRLPPVAQRVMANMMFNIGPTSLAQFTRFLSAMQNAQYPQAAEELKNSAWYRQVGDRGKRRVAQLIEGENA